MERPIAFKLAPSDAIKIYQVRAEPIDTASVGLGRASPAIVIARKATILDDLSTGLVDAKEIVSAQDGDWNNALLVIVGETPMPQNDVAATPGERRDQGDEAFVNGLSDTAPHLAKLAREILELVRSMGVDGELVEKTKGRWVNSPVNSFTLKAQPRKGDIQFTLYGNPSSYDAGGFLRQDQNSYSRGWVANNQDANKFAGLVKQAHARRQR
jgi:hypothetical protein